MAAKDIKKVSELLIKIGELLSKNPSFDDELESFLNSYTSSNKLEFVDSEKISKLDLFQLIREQPEEEVEKILLGFTVKELREILKKYRFGSPSKLKTVEQVKNYIINQLKQRKTDVFHSVATQ